MTPDTKLLAERGTDRILHLLTYPLELSFAKHRMLIRMLLYRRVLIGKHPSRFLVLHLPLGVYVAEASATYRMLC